MMNERENFSGRSPKRKLLDCLAEILGATETLEKLFAEDIVRSKGFADGTRSETTLYRLADIRHAAERIRVLENDKPQDAETVLHEWEPDFSNGEPAKDDPTCGVCGRTDNRFHVNRTLPEHRDNYTVLTKAFNTDCPAPLKKDILAIDCPIKLCEGVAGKPCWLLENGQMKFHLVRRLEARHMHKVAAESPHLTPEPKKHHTVSPEGKKKIAAAQRRRWAKLRAEQKRVAKKRK